MYNSTRISLRGERSVLWKGEKKVNKVRNVRDDQSTCVGWDKTDIQNDTDTDRPMDQRHSLGQADPIHSHCPHQALPAVDARNHSPGWYLKYFLLVPVVQFPIETSSTGYDDKLPDHVNLMRKLPKALPSIPIFFDGGRKGRSKVWKRSSVDHDQ